MRIAKGMDIKTLAEIAGVSKSALWYAEHGVFSTRPKTLQRIADALGCSVAALMASPPETPEGRPA